jgi:hypothetical protein
LCFIRRPRYCAENTQNVKYKVIRVNYNSCKGKLGYSRNNYVGPANALELYPECLGSSLQPLPDTDSSHVTSVLTVRL